MHNNSRLSSDKMNRKSGGDVCGAAGRRGACHGEHGGLPRYGVCARL
jgi:hypothetical protein